MDLARKFRSAPSDLYDKAYKDLQDAFYDVLQNGITPEGDKNGNGN